MRHIECNVTEYKCGEVEKKAHLKELFFFSALILFLFFILS